MALTRKFLSALGIEADKVDEIITAHVEVTDGLKSEMAKYKEKADTADSLQSQLDEANRKLESAGENEYKEKYESEHAELEKLKAEIAGKETRASKEKAYKAILEELGIPDNWYSRVLKGVDFDSIELVKDGSVKDKDKLADGIKSEWSDIIPTTHVEGAQTSHPPTNSGGSAVTKESILKIKDTGERQKAIAENHELFGF